MAEKSSFQPAKLDVDPSILDSNLMIVSNLEAEQLNSLFPSVVSKEKHLSSLLPEDDFPSTTAIPKPGLCVKTKDIDGTKFFINLCKLTEIPPPPPIEESELTRMIETEDYTNLWRVPMSLGAPRKEKDKSGNTCTVAEVAINTSWFDGTMSDSMVFISFVVTVAMEGLADKYGNDARLDRQNWTILKNKKFLGESCPPHRIQQRPTSGIEQLEGKEPSGSMIKELKSGESGLEHSLKRDEKCVRTKEKKILSTDREPEFKIIKRPIINPTELEATIWLPGVKSSKEITLDVGGDRIVMTCTKQQYLLDIFLPFSLDNDNCYASYQSKEQVLSVGIPLL